MPKRARSARYGSGGSKKARRARPRVTYRKKSAFRRRKSFSAKRAPVTECKKKEIEPTTPIQVNTSATDIPSGTVSTIKNFVYIPDVWATMKRGFNPDEMVGQDMFLKWLHVKVRLNFGQNGMLNLTTRVRVRAIHGWIMLPGCVVDEGDNTDYLNEAKNVLSQEMDKILSGPDKTKIRILSDRTITRNPMAVIDSGGTVQLPKRSQDLHFKWAPMRKIRYSQAKTGVADTYIPDPTVGLWIPFYVLWDQSSGEAPLAPPTLFKPSNGAYYQKREEMYFTDS